MNIEKENIFLDKENLPDIKCYFVLMGCIRQFFIDELGKEVTSNFFTEEQAIPVINEQRQKQIYQSIH